MLFHVTSEKRLPKILKNGFNRHELPLSTEYAKEVSGIKDEEDEEYFSDCSADAQEYLDEELGRPDSVYFWISKDRALISKSGLSGLPYKLVILGVNPDKIPCVCKVSDTDIADEIYYEYYHACVNDILVQHEKIEELVEKWNETVRTYEPDKTYPDDHEVWCPCDIPPDAIEKIYDENGDELCKRDENGLLTCKVEDAISWEHKKRFSRGSLIREEEIF